MLDVCLLGTAGMMPSPTRWLTALMLRYNGSNLLIDSGEGTQIAIKETGISVNPIDVIMFTHYHADHKTTTATNKKIESPRASIEKILKYLAFAIQKLLSFSIFDAINHDITIAAKHGTAHT